MGMITPKHGSETISIPRDGTNVAIVPRLFTVEDLTGMPSELPSGPVLYELDNGRLITIPPPGDQHGAVELNIGAALKYLGEHRGHGKARSGEVGLVLWRDPDRVVGVDALFICNDRLPLNLSSEGYLETIPDFVAEIRSKNDTLASMDRKAQDYLTAGVRVVWIVDPIQRIVIERRPEQEPRTFREGDDLTLDDIIPDFELSVRDALRE